MCLCARPPVAEPLCSLTHSHTNCVSCFFSYQSTVTVHVTENSSHTSFQWMSALNLRASYGLLGPYVYIWTFTWFLINVFSKGPHRSQSTGSFPGLWHPSPERWGWPNGMINRMSSRPSGWDSRPAGEAKPFPREGADSPGAGEEGTGGHSQDTLHSPGQHEATRAVF